jgi:ammonium transporter, Amt family
MTIAELKVGADTAWTMLTGFLVFFMNAGFGLVEAGLCRKKNATMILSKNFVVFAIATLGFYAVGFGLMFSDGSLLGWSGGWLLSGADNSPATRDAYRGAFGALGWAGIPLLAKFLAVSRGWCRSPLAARSSARARRSSSAPSPA